MVDMPLSRSSLDPLTFPWLRWKDGGVRPRLHSSLLSPAFLPRLARVRLPALATHRRRVLFMGLPLVTPKVALVFVGQPTVAVVPLNSLFVGVAVVRLKQRLGVEALGALVTSERLHSAEPVR